MWVEDLLEVTGAGSGRIVRGNITAGDSLDFRLARDGGVALRGMAVAERLRFRRLDQ